MNPTRIALAVGIASLLSLAAYSNASAATGYGICVAPYGAHKCYAKIQDAVDYAKPYSTIHIYPGVYKEYVVIPYEKPGLTLQGTDTKDGGAIIEGFRKRGMADPDTETIAPMPGITIEADNTTIKNLTVRNAVLEGILVDPKDEGRVGAETYITKVRVLAPGRDCIELKSGAEWSILEYNDLRSCDIQNDGDNEDGIDVDADHVTIAYNLILGAADEGIDVDADHVYVTGNHVERTNNDCVEVDGDYAKIEGNNLEVCDDDGVDLDGDYGKVAYNTINLVDEQGIEVIGDNVVIDSNRIESVDEEGIQVEGDYPTITYNYVNATLREGIEVDCPFEPPAVTAASSSRGDDEDDENEDDGEGGENERDTVPVSLAEMPEPRSCSGGKVSYNRVYRAMDECIDIELEIQNGDEGFWVEHNYVMLCEEQGIDLEGDHFYVNYNDAWRIGDFPDDEAGIFLEGDKSSINENKARVAYGDGIEVEGDRNYITYNETHENCEDGIEIREGEYNHVKGNYAYANTHSGIEIDPDASKTTVERNEALWNRVDFCDEGVDTYAHGNVFGTVSYGPCPVPPAPAP